MPLPQPALRQTACRLFSRDLGGRLSLLLGDKGTHFFEQRSSG